MVHIQKWLQPNFREINKFYKKNGHKGKANGDDIVFYAYQCTNDSSQEVIAAVRLCPIHSETTANITHQSSSNAYTTTLNTPETASNTTDYWLRSMWVHTDMRGQGIGVKLLAAMTDFFESNNTYCFPYDHLKSFYQQAKFSDLSSCDIPQPLNEKYQQYMKAGAKIILMGRVNNSTKSVAQ
jgi:GNAT superfamily N-acetyltransferase